MSASVLRLDHGATPMLRCTPNSRNSAHLNPISTAAGEVDVQIPKLRQGSFFSALLSPCR